MSVDLTKISVCSSKIKSKPLQKIDKTVKSIEQFFGGKGKIITNGDGDMILIRQNKKIRFDVKDPHGDKPHFHLEEQLPSGKWTDATELHRYYFTKD